jgi:hypothetical protein
MRYKALVGMNYPVSPTVITEMLAIAMMPEGEERQARTQKVIAEGGFKRIEAGAIVDDLPIQSTPWLLEQNMIEPVEGQMETAEAKRLRRSGRSFVPAVPTPSSEPTSPAVQNEEEWS